MASKATSIYTPVLRDEKPVTHNGVAVFVRRLTLGGRRRVKEAQQRAVLGGVRLSGELLRRAMNGDSEAVKEALESQGVLASELSGNADRQTALLISETAVTAAGVRIFPTPEDAEEVDGGDADAILAAIEGLAPVDPTVEQIQATAGNSDATG